MTSQPDPLVKVWYYRKRSLEARTLSEMKPAVTLLRWWERIVEEMKPEERCGHE